MSTTKNFTFGIFVGAAVGSIIALLYAPDKGSNTRDMLSYRLSTYSDELTDIIDRIYNEKQMISDAKKQGDLVVEDARQRAEDLIKEAEELLGSMESEINSTHETNGTGI